MDEKDTVTEMPKGQKQPRTAASIRKAIEDELKETRVKEARGKVKKLIEELTAAKSVVSAKEQEIAQLFEDYADVIPE